MVDLPADVTTLALLVFTLGARHGLDADHLAAIDGLTRYNAAEKPRLARSCGLLFSFGHGAVVVAIALAVSLISARWNTPEWLQTAGAWVSIICLTILGVLNLHAVLRTPRHEAVQPVGIKGRWLGRLLRSTHPAMVILVGTLFAASFDTVSQAALFAVTGAQLGGWHNALMLGLLFMLGMLITDGLNGYFVFHLIARADRAARSASRLMGLSVAALSLLVAAIGAARLTSPAIDHWNESNGLLFSSILMGIVIVSFAVAARAANARQPAKVATE